MIQDKTIEILLQIATPLVARGVFSEAELNELKCINQQREINPDVIVFPRLVKIKEAANYLGVAPKTIHDYINCGKLKRYKFGRRSARITAESLLQFLQDSEY